MAAETRVRKLFETLNSLLARQDLLVERKTELLMDIKEHESFLETRDEVRDFFADLYNQSSSATKSVYEGLLTTLVNEVMPDNDEAHAIRFNSSIKNNKTALNIECVTKDGETRDIYKDKGGTIESIVALGLRFIALSKTKNRRIILVDEPDAWIKTGPKYIPKLAALLPQLARELGMQVVYISHHDPKYFTGHARIIELTKDNGLHAEAIEDDVTTEDWERADGIGWRFIRLTNVKQHENTLIELSPYVNMLIGDGDLGKTTVIDAVESLINNSGREGLIRTGAPYCRVEIGIEDGMVIEWTYHRKAKRKTSYQLLDANGKPIHKSDSSDEVPEWLHEYLAMAPHQDYDLHFGDAHKVSFILDKAVTAHKRAEILSWGGETRQIQMLMRMHSEESKSRSAALNASKAELNKVKSKLEVLRPLQRAAQAFANYQEIIETANNSKSNTADMKAAFERLEDLEKKLICLESVRGLECVSVSERITVRVGEDMAQTVKRMSFLEQSLNVLRSVPSPVSTNVRVDHNKVQLLEAGRALSELQKKLEALQGLPKQLLDSKIDQKVESSNLSTSGSGLSQLKQKIAKTQAEIQKAEEEMRGIQKEKNQLLINNNGQCVFCHSLVSDKALSPEVCSHD